MAALLFQFLALLSLTIAIVGIISDRYWFLLIGAVLAFPFSYTLSTSMDFSGFILLPAFYLGSAAAVYNHNKTVAWLILTPVFFMALFLLATILVFTYGVKEGTVY